MKKYKNKLNNSTPILPQEEDEDKVDFNSMEVVVERVSAGLIGNLRIDNDINKPIFKQGDYVQLRYPSKILPRDFVLYHSHDEHFLRRIIKFKDGDIYVAGDNEKQYRIIKKEDILGKVISRERKNKRLSFSLTPKKRLYTFKKVNLAFFRIKNRIIHYEQEVNLESLELASQALQESKSIFENKTDIKYNIDLDTDLNSFLNPDTLVMELQEAMTHTENPDEDNQNQEEENTSEGEEVHSMDDENVESSDEENEESEEMMESTEELDEENLESFDESEETEQEDEDMSDSEQDIEEIIETEDEEELISEKNE